MLKLLRSKKVKKRILYPLAAATIFSFILWGSFTAISDRKNKNHAGIIFGKRISYDEYQNALHAWRVQMRMKFGDQSFQIEKILDVNKAVWDRLILTFETNRRKIKVGDKELTSYITALPFLQKDDTFDPELYDLFLRYSINTPSRVFEEQVRLDIKFKKIFDQVTENVKVDDQEIRDKYRYENEKIKIKYLSVFPKDLQKEIEVSPDELKEFYEKQKEELKIPIQVNLYYVGIDYPKSTTPKVKQEIDNKLKEIHNFLKEGNDLISAKEKFKLEIKETGFFALGEPTPEFGPLNEYAENLFNLKEEEFTDIIKTERGPYIFQLKEKRVDYLSSFEEVKEKIEDKIKSQKAKELARARIEQYDKEIKNKKQSDLNLDLASIVKQLNISIKETDFFGANAQIPDLGFSKEIFDAAFKLKDKEISDIIELNNGYLIASVVGRKKIEEEEFQKQKETLEKNLFDEKKNKKFEEFFEGLKKEAKLVDYIKSLQNKSAQSN